MNIFSNAERGVNAFSFNKKELRRIDMMSDTAAANSGLRKHAAMEKNQEIADAAVKASREFEIRERNEELAKHGIVDSQLTNKINAICSEAKLAIFKNIVFEVFYNSLVIDNDFLVEHLADLQSLTDTYIDNNGGFKLLEDAIKSTDSVLLKRIKTICESCANIVTERNMCNSAECDIDPLNKAFNMTEDEKDKLDYAKKDIDIDAISELVKNKVLTVVRDEKERQEHSSELIQNIEEDLKANDEVVDEKSLNEALTKIVLQKSPIEEDTLFNSLIRDSYTDVLENVAITSTDKENHDDHKEMAKSYDVNMTEDDLLNNDHDAENDDETIENKEINMDLVLDESSNNLSVDMDLVLVEALTKYTLMETLYTLKLENYTRENLRKLTEKILNPVTESAQKSDDNTFIKIRSGFFKHFNNIKNQKDVDNAKKGLENFISKCSSEDKIHVNKYIDTGIEELKSIAEKNPHMKKYCEETSEWLKGLQK